MNMAGRALAAFYIVPALGLAVCGDNTAATQSSNSSGKTLKITGGDGYSYAGHQQVS